MNICGSSFWAGTSAAGTVDADAPPPTTASDMPAIPNVGTTALLRRFPVEECLTRAIAVSSSKFQK
jgi:hypothetical protein